jgi:hypothetical protein
MKERDNACACSITRIPQMHWIQKTSFLPVKEPFIAWLYTERSKSIGISLFPVRECICMYVSSWMPCFVSRTSAHVKVNGIVLSTCVGIFLFSRIRYVMKVNVKSWKIIFGSSVCMENIKMYLLSFVDLVVACKGHSWWVSWSWPWQLCVFWNAALPPPSSGTQSVLPWRWRHLMPPKCWYLSVKLLDIIYRKTVVCSRLQM